MTIKKLTKMMAETKISPWRTIAAKQYALEFLGKEVAVCFQAS